MSLPMKWSSRPARVISLASRRYSGPMNPTTLLTREGLVAARQAVRAGLHRHLVGVVVRVGRERRALAGLEVHDVRALGRALRGAPDPGLVEHRHADAEVPVGALAAGNTLEHQIERRAGPHRGHLDGDVAEHAVLGRHAVLAHQVLHRGEDVDRAVQVTGRRVHADHRVAVAVGEAVLAPRRARLRRRRSGGWAAGGWRSAPAGRGWRCSAPPRAASCRPITRSMLLISLATAATISGVRPGLTAAISSPVVRWSRIHSRSCATVQVDTLA
jgi:hypothetical protein